MEKVLVIGGNGFIGKNVVEFFQRKGIYVGVYDLNLGEIGNNNYAGNIREDANFDSIISSYDAIIYLITTVSPKKSMEDSHSAYMNDIPLLLKTLNSCLNVGIKRIVFASSGGTVYGNLGNVPAKETDMNEPINHYAICKLTSEKILEMYNKLYNMQNISLRISNPYGKYQNPNSGVGVIATFVNKIKNGEEITLFGIGDTTRDFIEVSKVAEAFYLACQWEYDGSVWPVFNIGSGQGLSLIEIVKIIAEIYGEEIKINYLPERLFDLKYNVLDISKAEKYLEFNSSVDEKENIKKYAKTYLKKRG